MIEIAYFIEIEFDDFFAFQVDITPFAIFLDFRQTVIAKFCRDVEIRRTPFKGTKPLSQR